MALQEPRRQPPRLSSPIPIPTNANKVVQCVRNQCGCEPGLPEIIDNDEHCPVWRVPVIKGTDGSPEFWYVCTFRRICAYRPDLFLPNPYVSMEDQSERDVLEFIKSFHVGIQVRFEHFMKRRGAVKD